MKSNVLRSSVLIVDSERSSAAATALGADLAKDFASAETAMREFSYPVIALSLTARETAGALHFVAFAAEHSPLSQRVVIKNDASAETLQEIVNLGSVFRILPSIDDGQFTQTLQEALEEFNQLRQNAKLLQLVNEQNERLKKLTAELEERVEARRKSLEEAKEKLLVSNARVEALHRALVAIHRAGSIAAMERLINEALTGALGLIWTRILFQSQARIEMNSSAAADANLAKSSGLTIFVAPLLRRKETVGHIHFARAATKAFTREETAFLGRIGEAVSLAVDRLNKLEQSETLKHQWEATFDAIADPVSLINAELTIVRTNRSFAEHSKQLPETIIGKKCHEVLFKRDEPCEGCAIAGHASQIGFRLKPSRASNGANVIFDVFSQMVESKFYMGTEGQPLFVNMYHDVSAQLRSERQILESAKLAELGTIGSSIAHELNNPLGGMLSFIQLIKMDLKGKEPYFDDILEMEKGALRCRDIVQSLLGFTRKSANESFEQIDLREVVQQALKITELQTRAMGIHVTQDLPSEPVMVNAEFNALAQAFRHFLQQAQASIAAQSAQQAAARTHGEIKLNMFSGPDWVSVEITDNGAEPTDIELGVTEQIIRDHGGRIEVRSAKGVGKGVGRSAIIAIPRPVFDP